MRVDIDICIQLSTVSSCLAGQVNNNNNDELNGGREKEEKKKRKEKKSMIIVVPSCLKDADGARTRSDQNSVVTLLV